MVTTTETSQDFHAIEKNTRRLSGKACFGTMIVMVRLQTSQQIIFLTNKQQKYLKPFPPHRTVDGRNLAPVDR